MSMSMYQREDVRIKFRLTNEKQQEGTVNILGFERLSDFLLGIASDFITIYDLDDTYKSGDKVVKFVNKRQILWIEPLNE